jgi:hypothetical protein
MLDVLSESIIGAVIGKTRGLLISDAADMKNG